ncbi:hypothetical protein ACX80W_13580 [Arthrobacter sp. TMN-37]
MRNPRGTPEPADNATGASPVAGDRRGSVLEPESGAGGPGGSHGNIRDQQGTSAGGSVPPGFSGGPGGAPADSRPEDASGSEVPDVDAPGVDVPGADAPGVDAPGVESWDSEG